MAMYIGLDVHSKQTTYCVQEEDGKVRRQGEVETSAVGMVDLVGAVGAEAGTKIGMETGSQANWLARVLAGMGMEPVVIDAAEVRKKARRPNQKSDTRDAFEICDGLRRGMYSSVVYVPGAEVQRLREILSRRRHFVALCTKEGNAAKYILRSVGMSQEVRGVMREVTWERMLSNPVLKGLRPHLELHAEVWRVSHQNVQRLDAELEEGLGPFHEEEARLETMPGVGRIVAATFLAVMGTPERFPDAKHAASYIGLVPATYDSGERECHGRITKHGSAELRSMLCEAGHHASNPRHPLYPYYARIAAKSGYKKAVTAVAHRMARILYQMWRHQEGFDLGKLAVEYREHVVQKKRFYQFKNPDNAHGTNSPQAN